MPKEKTCLEKGIWHWWVRDRYHGGGWSIYKCQRCSKEIRSRRTPPVVFDGEIYYVKPKKVD
jgi:hypothetical protein